MKLCLSEWLDIGHWKIIIWKQNNNISLVSVYCCWGLLNSICIGFDPLWLWSKKWVNIVQRRMKQTQQARNVRCMRWKMEDHFTTKFCFQLFQSVQKHKGSLTILQMSWSLPLSLISLFKEGWKPELWPSCYSVCVDVSVALHRKSSDGANNRWTLVKYYLQSWQHYSGISWTFMAVLSIVARSQAVTRLSKYYKFEIVQVHGKLLNMDLDKLIIFFL